MGQAVQVVRFGASCDVVTTADDPPWRAQFAVAEFAELSDGRRITLSGSGARGFGTQLNPAAREKYESIWQTFSPESLEADVRTTLLPDANETEADWWARRAEMIRDATGVALSWRDIKAVPYVIEFSDRVVERLPAADSPA